MGKRTHRRSELDAVVGFVDLAGFTAATERLGRHGSAGLEELRGLINVMFSAAIDPIHAVGGEIGWFAGDAMGALFHRSVTGDVDAVNAMASAARAVAALPEFMTVAGPLSMGAKVGLAAGPVRWHTLEGPQDLDWFSGDAVDLSAAAEALASPGQVILHPSMTEHLAASGLGTTVAGDGFHHLLEVLNVLDVTDAAASAPVLARAAQGAPFASLRNTGRQPERVARLALAGDAGHLDEHRPVTALFAGFPAPTHDIATLVDVVEILEGLGGFVAVGEGDKGAEVFALFGVPTALADRHRRAVGAAEQVRQLVPDARFGVASGRVYSGRIGSEHRWDYGALGDRVNTAARLKAAAAPGEILIDQVTLDGAGVGLRSAERRELVLKGKAAPEVTTVVETLGRRTEAWLGSSGRFVGRREESEELFSWFDEPGVHVLVGPAGAGKSRLVAHVVDQLNELAGGLTPLAEAAPLHRSAVNTVSLDQIERGQPYLAWRRLLCALADTTPAAFVDGLEPALAGDDRLSLLAPILGVVITDTPLVASLSPEDRLEVLGSFVVEVVESIVGDTPRRMLIEDLHWADGASLALFDRVAGRLTPSQVSLVATGRPDETLDWLLDASAVRSLQLPDIDDASMTELFSYLWQERFGVDATAGLCSELTERAAGSPLFAEQLVAFCASHQVDPTATSLPGDLGVPSSLVDLVLARLDRLPQQAAVVASYGAVFGRSFGEHSVVGAFGAMRAQEEIVAGIEILRDQDVVAGVEDLRFTHSLLQETLHDRMSLALRAELHQAALEYLESEHGDDLESVAGALARHAENTTDQDRQRTYFRSAADLAAASYANDVSTYWYRKLLPLHDGPARGQVAMALAEIELVAGDPAEAEQLFREASRALNRTDRSRAELGLARALTALARNDEGFALLDDLIANAEEAQNWGVLRDGMELKADVATMLGDFERAEQVEAHHQRLSALLGSGHPLSKPLVWLMPLLWIRGQLEEAVIAYEGHVEELLGAGDVNLAGTVLADLAGIHYDRGELGEMFRTLDQARRLFDRVGNRVATLLQIDINEVEVRLCLGQTEEAFAIGNRALRVAVDLGNLRGMGALLCRLGSSPMCPDRKAVITRGAAIMRDIGDLVEFEQSTLDLLASENDPVRDPELVEVLVGLSQPGAVIAERSVVRIARLCRGHGEVGDPNIQLVESIATSSESVETAALASALLVDLKPASYAVEDARDICRAAFALVPTVELARALVRLDDFAEPEVSLRPLDDKTVADFAALVELVDQHHVFQSGTPADFGRALLELVDTA